MFGIGDLASQVPGPIRQMFEMLLNDAQDLVSMTPTSYGVLRLLVRCL